MSAPDTPGPLLQADRKNPVARFRGEEIGINAFLGDVWHLANRLPEAPGVNLCANRYLFLVTFCALVVRGQHNLLPPNRQSGTLAAFKNRFPKATWLSDEVDCPSADWIVVRGHERSDRIPHIDADQLCAVAFTSGSTGEPKAIHKTWHTIVGSTQKNLRYYWDSLPASVLATVPPQHMYGLESTVWMPLRADLCIADSCPLYPADVADSLAALTTPRCLVSTPTHLRAMVQSGESLPQCDFIVSATSPLDAALAHEVETRFGGTCREIFGSSETGSLAWRRTANESRYQTFPGFTLTPMDDHTVVDANHLPEAGVLSDIITLDSERRFEIAGRAADLVNIGGKRGSLTEINARLLNIPGVRDAVCFVPDNASRLAAIIVSSDVDATVVRRALREYFDPVFIPRPILFSDRLPRTESSKLPRGALLEHYHQLRNA